jgi:hypothetical protein
LATNFVLCKKSTDLSWEGEEPSTEATEKNLSPAVEESASLPQGEPVAPGAEAAPPEATVVEGMYNLMTPFAPGSRSPKVLTSHVL